MIERKKKYVKILQNWCWEVRKLRGQIGAGVSDNYWSKPSGGFSTNLVLGGNGQIEGLNGWAGGDWGWFLHIAFANYLTSAHLCDKFGWRGFGGPMRAWTWLPEGRGSRGPWGHGGWCLQIAHADNLTSGRLCDQFWGEKKIEKKN